MDANNRTRTREGNAVWRLALLAAVAACVPAAAADGPWTLTDTDEAPNGSWCWFQSPRAVIDHDHPDGPMLLIGSVSSGPVGCGDNHPERGDVDLFYVNLESGQRGVYELHDRLQADDHNVPALLIRPDGRYLAVYSRHNVDRFTFWRVSTNPGDPTDWGPIRRVDNGAGTTYSNVFHLPDDRGGLGRTYNFTRSVNFDPSLAVSEDGGSTWPAAEQLIRSGNRGVRPYARYASDGRRIGFVMTEQHPRNYTNSLYYAEIEDGRLLDAAGSVLDDDIFDAERVDVGKLPLVFRNGTEVEGDPQLRAWPVDARWHDGTFSALFTTRANDSRDDHRLLQATRDDSGWQVRPVAKMGGYLYPKESDYTGLAALDPGNPGRVYVSTPVSPLTGETLDHYQLFEGVLDADGDASRWRQLTDTTDADNLRPICVRWDDERIVLGWMRGEFHNYQRYETDLLVQVLNVPAR